MLITLFLNPVGWAGALGASSCSASSTSSSRTRPTGSSGCPAARHHGRRRHGRRLREPGAASLHLVIWSSGHLVIVGNCQLIY